MAWNKECLCPAVAGIVGVTVLCEIWFSQVRRWKCSYHTSVMFGLWWEGIICVPNCGPAIIKEYLVPVRHAFSPCNRGCVSKLEGYYNAS